MELVDYDRFCGAAAASDSLVPQVSPAEAAEFLAAGDTIFIDVRDTHERLVDCLPNSRHVPLDELIGSGVDLPTSARLVIYCASGTRSLLAAEALIKRGYARVHNLEGGLALWRRTFPA